MSISYITVQFSILLPFLFEYYYYDRLLSLLLLSTIIITIIIDYYHYYFIGYNYYCQILVNIVWTRVEEQLHVLAMGELPAHINRLCIHIQQLNMKIHTHTKSAKL